MTRHFINYFRELEFSNFPTSIKCPTSKPQERATNKRQNSIPTNYSVWDLDKDYLEWYNHHRSLESKINRVIKIVEHYHQCQQKNVGDHHRCQQSNIIKITMDEKTSWYTHSMHMLCIYLSNFSSEHLQILKARHAK